MVKNSGNCCEPPLNLSFKHYVFEHFSVAKALCVIWVFYSEVLTENYLFEVQIKKYRIYATLIQLSEDYLLL